MSPVPASPRAWFYDTCTLMNLQVSNDLDTVVQQQMVGEDVVLLDAVVDELDLVAGSSASGAPLAAAALTNLAWLGPPQPVDDYADTDRIVFYQDQVADGRGLKHAWEHWAEACILAAVEVLPEERGAVAFLTDEYAARIQAVDFDWCTPMSVHRYLYELVHESTITAAAALSISEELHKEGRGPECVLADFTATTPKGLGRVGRP